MQELEIVSTKMESLVLKKKIPMHGIRYSLFILTEVLYRFGDATCYMERHFQSIQMGVDVLGGISLVFNVITSNL